MTDLVCRVPSHFIPASFQPNPHTSLVCEAPPPHSIPVFSAPQSIANPPQVPLNRSLTARNAARESNSFSQDVNDFWSFNWWRDASGGERALGLGVATLAALPTVTALGVAAVSSGLGMGCGGTSEPEDGGSYGPPPRINRPPVLESIGTREVRDGESIEIVLRASDPDGDPLTYSVFDRHIGGTLTGNIYRWNTVGRFSNSPYVLFTVRDPSGAADEENVNIRILPPSNPPPPPPPPPPPQNRRPYFTNENSHVELSAGENIRFDFDAVDPDGDSITYSLDRVQYTAPGTDGAPRTVLHALTAYASYFDRSSGILNVPTNSRIAATYVFTVSARDSRGLSASTELTADLVLPMPPPPPPPPPDRDGDGFRADVDCDDGNASVRPLRSGGITTLNTSTTICAGTYGDVQLHINGTGVRVISNDAFRRVILSGLYSYLMINANSSVVRDISIPSAQGRCIASDPEWCSFRLLEPVISIGGSSNVVSNINAGCEIPRYSGCVGMRIWGSNNEVSYSSFVNGYKGVLIQSGAGNNRIHDSIFRGHQIDSGACWVDQSRLTSNRFYSNSCL